jgi:hypothetical protein
MMVLSANGCNSIHLRSFSMAKNVKPEAADALASRRSMAFTTAQQRPQPMQHATNRPS